MVGRHNRAAGIVAGLVACALAVAACGGEGKSAQGGEGDGTAADTFTAWAGSPDFLGPPGRCYSSECAKMLNLLYTGLVDWNPKTGETFYRMAKSIESQDQRHWTITIKDGWTFHNGEPVTARSYVRAWNWNAYAPNGAATASFFTRFEGHDALNPEDPDGDGPNRAPKPDAKQLSGLTVVDRNTFEVTLDGPFAQFPQMLMYEPAFAPVSKECLSDVRACNTHPIGNGPYRMRDDWQRNNQVVVTRAENYQGRESANTDTIQFIIYQSMDTAFRDFLAGNLDMMPPPPENVPQARQRVPENRRFVAQTSAFDYIGFPLYQKAYQDKRVRQALSLAINRKAIVENVFAGLEEPAQSVVSPVVKGHRPSPCDYCRFDPQRARTLMRQAGGFPRQTMTVWYNAGGGHAQWVQAVANQWRKAFGVRFNFQSLQFPSYLEKLRNHNMTGPFRLGWLMDYPAMVNYLRPHYSEESSSNHTGFFDQRFQELLAKGARASTPQKSIRYYQRAEDIVLEQMPVIPITMDERMYVHSGDVSDVGFNAVDTVEYGKVKVIG